MKFFKKIFKKGVDRKKGAFFGSSEQELQNLLCGIGESEIQDSTIKIIKYPFAPSSVYPEKEIKASEITAISWDAYPPLIKLKNEVIFISRQSSEDLKLFANRNEIETFEASRNWDWLLEPFLDTEYSEETDVRLKELLNQNGITPKEIYQIRSEVEEQMLKYNFDTMLWEWCGLGLPDVLAAMRVKYDEQQFVDFFNRAMKIELRTKNTF